MTDRDDARVSKALQGIDFPTDLATLLIYAEARETDPKTLQALTALPDQQYTSMQHVLNAVPQEPEGHNQPGGTNR